MLEQSNQNNKLTIGAFGLMMALVMLPMIEGGFDHDVIYWVLFFLLGITAISIAQRKQPVYINLNHPLTWFFLFVMWGGISIIWSINPHRTLVEFLQLVSYGLVFFLATQLNKDNLYRVGRIVLIAGVGISILGLSVYLFIGPSRIQGTFTNSNPFGIYLVMLFCYAWGYYLRHPGKWVAGSAIILLVTLALSGSRGSMIALLIALPLLFTGFRDRALLINIGKTFLCLILALLLTKGVIMAAPYTQGNIAAERLLTQFITRADSFPSSVEGRLAFWEVGGRLVLSEPVHGYGLGTQYLAYYLEYGGDRWYARFTHNHYIQTAVELGLIGLGLLVGFIITCGLVFWRKFKRQKYPDFLPGALAGIVAFLLHIGIDFSWNFPGTAVIFFALVGAAVGNKPPDTDLKGFNVNYRWGIGAIAFLFFLTSWHYTAGVMHKHGVKLAFEDDIRGATNFYDKANTLYPINPMGFSFASQNYLLMAREKKDNKLMEKSLVLARRAVELSPVDGILQNRLGMLYWEMGNTSEAEQHLILGAKYAAYRLGEYLDLGRFYIQQQRLDDAENILLQGLQLKNAVLGSASSQQDKEKVIAQLVDLHLFLANIYHGQGKNDLVQYHFVEARELNEEHPVVKQYFNRN